MASVREAITSCLCKLLRGFDRHPCPLEVVPRRILWIRLDHIGDVTMSLPALHALRQRFPEARIDALVRPGVAPLLRDLPDVDRILTYDTPRFPEPRRGRPRRGAGFFRTLALINRLRRQRYDLAIEMRGDDIGRLLAYLSRAPLRLGPDRVFYEEPGTPNLSCLLTHPASLTKLEGEPRRHTVESDIALLAPLGVVAPAEPCRIPIQPHHRAAIQRKLLELGVAQPFAAIHAHSNDTVRDWSVPGFAQVADYLSTNHGMTVLLTGSRADSDYNQKIVEAAAGNSLINVAGQLELEELPALFEQAALMVTVDTGPMHIAAAVGTGIVSIFLPQLAPIHHPYGQRDGVVLPASAEIAALDYNALKRLSGAGACPLSDSVACGDVLSAIDRKLSAAAPE